MTSRSNKIKAASVALPKVSSGSRPAWRDLYFVILSVTHLGFESLGGSQFSSSIQAVFLSDPMSTYPRIVICVALCPHIAKVGLNPGPLGARDDLPHLRKLWGIIIEALRRLSANLYREEGTVDYLSDSASSPSVLEGYITETDLARQLKRSVRTLQRLAARRSGPPRIRIGRLIFYNFYNVVREWLSQQEQPRKPATNVKRYVRKQRRA
jgi:hypothetical protein